MADVLTAVTPDLRPLSTVAHDLRTPLSTVLGCAELLQDHWSTLSEPRRMEFLARIEGAARHLERLVEDLERGR